MGRSTMKYMTLLLALLLVVSVGGVFAVWSYSDFPPAPAETELGVNIGKFQYADIYITDISPTAAGGTFTKTGHTSGSADIASSGAAFEVTFYNGSGISYYYNEAETTSGSAAYTVSGIEKGDEVPSKTYKTLTVTFSGRGTADIVFHFTVDKADVEDVVARTAVDRFGEILNTPADYSTLTGAMNAHGNASTLTYIGNVVGANSSDSNTIKRLFGEEFMSMDLDGDGKTEPITMMIKRENLDGNNTTGDSYTYTSSGWWGETTTETVHGVEMTLYITAQSLSGVGRGDDIVVYAATFTKYEGSDKWVELVPLTKGRADANNYSTGAWGTANSFNTDTWISDAGDTMKMLVAQAQKG